MSNTATETALDIMQDIPCESMEDSVEDKAHTKDNSTMDSRQLSVREQYPNLAPCMGRWAEGDNAKTSGAKGGYESGKTKRRRRLMREAAQAILSADVSKLPLPEMEDLRLALKALGIDEVTGADAILLAQSIKAAKGDTEAARFVRDTSGEKPSVSVDVTASDRPVDAEMLGAMSDAELAALAEAQDSPALPQPQDRKMLQ